MRKYWSLQLFAEGISGVASAAAAGQQSTGESPVRANTTQAAAANTTRLTWAQILADPEYNREMQKTVSARLKAAQQAWEKKAGAGLLDGKPVPYEGKRSLGNDRARANVPAGQRDGRPVPYEGKRGFGNDRGGAQAARLRQHYGSLVAQEAKLRQTFPDFSLQQALRDPAFVHLTAPHVGVSVENAYYLRNRQKHQAAAMRVAARLTAEKMGNAIRSGSSRPLENGTTAQATAVTTFDYAHATAQQRIADTLDELLEEEGAGV
jgi:hypothetical protein